MSEPPAPSEQEQVRELLAMSWQLLLQREHLLKLATGLPAPDRERVFAIAEELEAHSRRVRGLIEDLPQLYGGAATPEEHRQALEAMRGRIDSLRQDLAAAAKTLYDLAGPPLPKGEEQAN